MFSLIGRKARQKKSAYEKAERKTLDVISRGERDYPSWIYDISWQKTFARSTLDEAIKAGMSEEQATNWFSQQEVADTIMTLTAQLEKASFSKLEQISGAMEFTGKLAAVQVRRWDT